MKGTLSKYKNELLFQRFQMNYNNEPKMFRKGLCTYQQKSIIQELFFNNNEKYCYDEKKICLD